MGILSSVRGLFVPPRQVTSPGPPRARMGLSGGYQGQVFPYDSAAVSTDEMGEWLPTIRGPDMEINTNRDRMVARGRDLVRNDGWASGSILRILDATIGGDYRLSAMPDYQALGYHYGRAFDRVWAEEFRQAVEAYWRGYAKDLGHYNDLSREITVTQQMRQAFGHMLVDGDALVLTHWKPERMGRGRAKFATSFQVVDPDRLSNPYQQVDSEFMRGGVELDADGVPVAYHVRKAEQNSYYQAVDSMVWERIEREDPDGWQRVVHHYERNRAAQHRGVGIFVPVISRMKMLARYYGVELQAATVASVFGTYIKSPYDPAAVEAAMSPTDEELPFYQGLRSDFHEAHKTQLNGVAMATLAPGESIETVKAERPSGNFTPFTHEMLRGVASCLGISYEELTQDYSETNYSSARAAIAVCERTVKRRKAEFNSGVANKVYGTWLCEAFEQGLLPLPNGAPDYVEARTEYARCAWRGPGTGIVDGVKERQASVLGMDAGLTTLAHEAAEESGSDWREILDQRAIELEKFKELGMVPPSWSGVVAEGGTDAPATPAKPVAT